MRSAVAATLSVVVTCWLCAPGWTATTRPFAGTYAGTGTGEVNGTTASGKATLTGKGSLIGPGTLTGSARGTFTTPTCAVFTGKATIKGQPGSIRISARRTQVCAGSADDVSFSGRAAVVGGTSAYVGAHGTLSFKGTYSSATGTVTIALRGRITY